MTKQTRSTVGEVCPNGGCTRLVSTPFQRLCNGCHERRVIWLNLNRDKVRSIARSFRARNLPRVRSSGRAFYAKYPNRYKASYKAYREANREKIANQKKSNREHINAVHRAWNKRNPEKVQRQIRKNIARPEWKLRNKLRNRIRKAIVRNGAKKKLGTLELLGCTIIEVRRHLEVQFESGMTWDNFGAWHIDHKLPCSKFDLSKEDEQRKCFHFTNLQPLWALDNLRKSNKIITGVNMEESLLAA